MVLVRSHDATVGKSFYRKLKAVRDALGLQYVFEVLFDDGTRPIELSEHFARRLRDRSKHCNSEKRYNGVGSGNTSEEGRGRRVVMVGEGDGGRDGGRRREGGEGGGGGGGGGGREKEGGLEDGGSGGEEEEGSGGVTLTYKSLEHLPCVVVFAGQNRPGLGFPRYACTVCIVLCRVRVACVCACCVHVHVYTDA